MQPLNRTVGPPVVPIAPSWADTDPIAANASAKMESGMNLNICDLHYRQRLEAKVCTASNSLVVNDSKAGGTDGCY